MGGLSPLGGAAPQGDLLIDVLLRNFPRNEDKD